MEFKGTKGRWSIYHRIDDNEENQYSVTSNNGKVCNCYNMSIPDYENKIAMANAQLISKAPEMLEMLKELVTSADDMFNNGEPSETYYQLLNKAEQLTKEATELK